MRRALVIVAGLMLHGCGSDRPPSPVRPADILARHAEPAAARSPAARAEAPKATVDIRAMFEEVRAEQATRRLAARDRIMNAGTPVSNLDTGSHALMRQLRIDARSPSALTASLDAIQAQLSPDDARAFTAAARLLMVSSLPPALMSGNRRVEDREIWTALLPAFQGRTPQDIVTSAHQVFAKLPVGNEAAPGGSSNQMPGGDQ